MSIHVALTHVTHYKYDRLVEVGPQTVRLRPAPHCRTRILSYSLKIEPAKHFINWQQDPQANYLARVVFPEPTRELRFEVELVAEMSVFNPFDFFLEPAAEQFPFEYDALLQRELAPYLIKLEGEPRFAAYLASIPRTPKRTIDFLVELNMKLATDVAYLIRMEPGVQTPEVTLDNGSGSCRDSAWLLVQLLRHLGSGSALRLGLPDPADARHEIARRPVGTQGGFHRPACLVRSLSARWWLDWPGSDFRPAGRRRPHSAGLHAGAGLGRAHRRHGGQERSRVPPRDEGGAHLRSRRGSPSPTPKSSGATSRAWVMPSTRELVADDVRLTMGGEPTFVSIDDPDGAEWNMAAMGPDKRRLAIDLYERLKQHYAPQGLAHFGQGKWYPGEPLPRWSLNCFWRRDGEPMWRDPELLDDERTTARVTAADAGSVSRRGGRAPGSRARQRVPGLRG